MATSARPTPSASVRTCPASAMSARLFVRMPAASSRAKSALAVPRTTRSRARSACAGERRVCDISARRAASRPVARRSLIRLARVTQGVADEAADVPVAQPVVHDPTGPPPLDRAALAQQTQLVAHAGLAESEQPREVAHAQLVREAERVEDAGPGRIGEQVEGRDDPFRLAAAEDTSDERSDVLRVEALDRAALEGQFHV